jgi:hypothetical protein
MDDRSHECYLSHKNQRICLFAGKFMNEIISENSLDKRCRKTRRAIGNGLNSGLEN